MARRVGRPSKLTPERIAKVLEALRAGNYVEAACGYANVSVSTFYRWLERGEQESKGQYREFREDIKKAQADAEAAIVAHWRKHIPKDWKACATFLERRYPERWGRRVIQQEVTGKGGGALRIEVQEMADDELIAQINRIGSALTGNNGSNGNGVARPPLPLQSF